MEEDGWQLAGNDPTAELQAARQEMKDILQRAIASLPTGERDVYELREIEELPGDEVAARLKITLPAMKSRLHRARANLRQYMDVALAR
jgi:RNA polymerase sigma-70 factor (ECF subfamily)